MGRVIVIGSVNTDYLAFVDSRPAAGETVLAARMMLSSGGKAANQAAAAARAGAETAFIGAVGQDAAGDQEIAELSRLGIAIDHLAALPGVNTGAAFVTVTPDGENSIVVASGANALLTGRMAIEGLDRIGRPAIVVLQTESPAEAVDAAAAWCLRHGIRVAINNGPRIPLAAATLAAADPLIVNEHEARQLCGENNAIPDGDLAAAVFACSGARSVVVTLGAAGVQLKAADASDVLPAVAAPTVVDTTGAGDAFVGTLAAGLADGSSLRHAAECAVDAAAKCVGWRGARPAVQGAAVEMVQC